MRLWSVTDVCRWLDTLSLQQYTKAFKEASVDGEFLLELREEDLAQVLGMEHKLHVRKVILARDKLRPLSEQEKKMKVRRGRALSRVGQVPRFLLPPLLICALVRRPSHARSVLLPTLRAPYRHSSS